VISPNEPQLRIEYPCEWSYRLIGTSEESMRALVRGILGETRYELALHRESRTGKYLTLKLTLIVRSDVHRLMLYRRLGRDAAVKYVL